MSNPSDDEQVRTIGLPRSTVQEIVGKGSGASKPKAVDRPRFDLRGPEIEEPPFRPGSVKPSSRLDGAPLDRDKRGDSEPDILQTIPPPGRRPAEREATPSAKRPAEEPRSRPLAGGRPLQDDPAPAGRGPSPQPRREPSPSPAMGRPLEDADLSTQRPHKLPTDPDFMAVIDAWDRLPEAVRAGIAAMVKAVAGR